MTLPANIERCRGFGDGPEDWLDECKTCQRRTAAWGGLPGGGVFMEPPPVIGFFCEFFISGDEL